MESLWQHLIFASDAEIMALWACGFLVLASVAGVMERRRLKRDDLQRVGWVPWLGIFIGCMIIGGGMLALALPKIMMS